MKRPKCKTRNHKILEEDIGSNIFDIDYRNIFLGKSFQSRKTVAKLDCCEYTKVKCFFILIETINRTI